MLKAMRVALVKPVAYLIVSVITGAGLLIALNAKDWSKAPLAKALGIDRSLITLWVNGERSIQPKHQNQTQALLEI